MTGLWKAMLGGAVLGVGVLITATALAGPKTKTKTKTKIEVCHVNAANDSAPFYGGTVFFGNVIEVAEAAVANHLDHDDGVKFGTNVQDAVDFFAGFGVKLRVVNADCWHYQRPTVDVCHLSAENESAETPWGTVYFGEITAVPDNQVDDHEAHGDRVEFSTNTMDVLGWLAGWWGLNPDVPTADCWFWQPAS